MKRDKFKSQEVANFVWANAANGHIDKQLFTSFEPVAASFLNNFIEQELANTAWSYSVTNVPAPILFNENFISACGKRKVDLQQKLYFNFISGSCGKKKSSLISHCLHRLQKSVVMHLSLII